MITNDVVQSLKKLAKSSTEAGLVLTAFAMKERSRKQIDVSRFRLNYLDKQGAKISTEKYLRVLQELERLGLIELTLSSRGNIRFMRPKYTYKSIGQVAHGKAKLVKLSEKGLPQLKDTTPVAPVTLIPAPFHRPKRKLIAVITRLSNGKVIKLKATERLMVSDYEELVDILRRIS